jgi:hypothetical protein
MQIEASIYDEFIPFLFSDYDDEDGNDEEDDDLVE